MYSFEGDFKRKPVQSLGGVSRKEHKELLIKRVQDERQKREDHRQRQASAVKIQALYRGFAKRKVEMEKLRIDFDNQTQLLKKTQQLINNLTLFDLVKKLYYFFKPNLDGQRLIFVFQHVLKFRMEYILYVDKNNGGGLYHLEKLLQISLRFIRYIASSTEPIALPMRMLEVFTSETTYKNITVSGKTENNIMSHILQFLVHHGYFQCMRCILNERVPSSVEKTTIPPTPLAASIYDLIMSPVKFAAVTTNKEFSQFVLRSVCETFLCASYSEQIGQFLLPAMAYSQYPFPFVELIQSLIEHTSNGDDMKHETRIQVSPSPYLLASLLTLSEKHIGYLKPEETFVYLKLLEVLLPFLPLPKSYDMEDTDSDSEEDMMIEEDGSFSNLYNLRDELLRLLDSTSLFKCILNCLRCINNTRVLETLCSVCHTLLLKQKMPVHKMRLLYSLAFNTQFVRNLWRACTSVSTTTCTGSSTPLLSMLGRGLTMSDSDKNRIVPLLYVFCAMFSHSLLTLHDADFYGDEQLQVSNMPFSIYELIPMGLALCESCLGIIELAHPDAKLSINEDYRRALNKTGFNSIKLASDIEERETRIWASLFKVISTLVRQLHNRDTRRPFCPVSHWLSSHISIQADRPSQIYRTHNAVFTRRPLGSLRSLTKTSYDDDGPPLANRDVRNLVILTELPFVVSFAERVKILQRLIQSDKEDNQSDMTNFIVGPSINVVIRRNYIYEDAFDKLSFENEPNMKLKMRVQLKNAAGLDEAGIDGGGVFREFLTVLLKSAFDPNRGFFQYTTDRLLYPNSHASHIEADYTKHYYFIGRMLGKAIYENMLVELPFASFYLAKILSRRNINLDIHYLQSLDPIVYKNLLFLKNYDKDVSELGLDFTVVNSGFGETEVVELKPNGRNIPVDGDNRIEYIHLMADYKINKQIRSHCSAFRQGMADVINLEWLQMFNHQELQVLISGSSIPINIDDLRKNTNYSGGFSETHPVIELFWNVVDSFTDQQKSQLLKFVTSCSQQPLLGFKDLYPAFCIHDAGQDLERLPTASTCMNLLKLPHFTEGKLLRSKLLYAIESNAGFELS